jgi:hypothetical protein
MGREFPWICASAELGDLTGPQALRASDAVQPDFGDFSIGSGSIAVNGKSIGNLAPQWRSTASASRTASRSRKSMVQQHEDQ